MRDRQTITTVYTQEDYDRDLAWCENIKQQEKEELANGTLTDEQGVMNLWRNVFELALNDATHNFLKVKNMNNRHRKTFTNKKYLSHHVVNAWQAQNWILNKSQDFRMVCDFLNVCPERAKLGAVKVMKQANKYLPEEHQINTGE
jgi:hypothetical protein